MAQLNDLIVAGASRLLNGLGVLGSANMDSIFPNVTDAYSLGASDKRWNQLYTKTSNVYQGTIDILTVRTQATIGNGAGSTSTTTGSLIVKGGIATTANSYFGGTITSTKFIGPLQGNSDSASLLKTSNSNTIIAASVWRGNITDGVVVWGENFKNKTDIGNEDTGDITLWLQKSGSAATLNMSIDGTYYAGGHNPVLHSANYTNYTVTKTGSGASGNWGINITGSSASCTGNAATATALTTSAGNTGQPIYFASGKPIAIDWHIGNSGTGEHNANNVTYNFCGYYTSNGPATSLGASTSDGALYAQAYNSTWVAQIAQDYRNGGLYVRGKNNDTWQSWYTILDSRNYTGILDSRYINASGDTMTGHLNATAGLSWNNANWAPLGNITCTPTANGQEWSIDVGSTSYTGSYFHVWSQRNSVSMLRCHVDNNAVDVPSGPFTVSGGNSYFTNTIICSAQIGNYGEGIRLNCGDNQWATITMGSSGDVGTHSNCWSIHRKNDNNFCISRGSSDGYNGLVMTSTGMGLGTTAPEARLHVTGDFFVYAGHSRFYTTSAGTSPGEAAIEIREVSMGTTSTAHDVAHSPRLGFHWGNRYWGQIAFFNSEFQFRSSDVNAYTNARANAFYGAVWNDYAEFRHTKHTILPGHVVVETGHGDLVMSTKRLQPGGNVVSDTFGFAIGETKECKTPIAVSGRVLVYPYEERWEYEPGDAVCTGPCGTVSKMTREEIREYPERIIGTVSEIPEYDTWGQNNVEVNGRIWIKVL